MLQWAKCQVYDAINFVINLSQKPVKKQTLLLIRTNNMGDYVLWRDMLKYIRASKRFQGHHITLLGNAAWKGLFESLDKGTVDEVIWADMGRFKADMRYRYHLLKQIHDTGYETVINTLHTRCKRMDDAFTIVCNSARRIGQASDDTNVYSFEKGYDNNLFHELYPDERSFEFEFDRSIDFTEFFLQAPLPEGIKAEISSPESLPDELKAKDYFILFPGSSSPTRIWKAENFKKVGEFISERYGWIPVVCGSKGDKPFADALKAIYTGPIIDMVGRTNLMQFSKVLKEAKLTVSIDTGTVHLAAVSGGTVFALFNGSHYGRYNPYPDYINPNIYGIYPDEVDRDLNKAPIPDKYNFPVHFDYNSISAEKVCKVIAENIKV